MPNPLDICVIDFNNLFADQVFPVYLFLKEQSEKGILNWFPNKTYEFWNKQKFRFEQKIFSRSRKSRDEIIPNELRYQVQMQPKHFASGARGLLYETDTLYFNIHGTAFIKRCGKDHKERTFKFQIGKTEIDEKGIPNFNLRPATKNMVWSEFFQSKKTSHLHFKEPTFAEEILDTGEVIKVSYSTMDKLPGKELFEIIDDLTSNERVELIVFILNLADEQILKPGLVHGDIKAENLIIHLEKGKPIIGNFCDYQFTVNLVNDSTFRGGTWPFVAPEILDKNTTNFRTHKVDVYALGALIACLLSVPVYNIPYFEEVEEGDFGDPFDVQEGIYQCFLQDLFAGLSLSKNTKTILRKLIIGMLQIDPSERFSLKNAINLASEIKYTPTYPPKTAIKPQINLAQPDIIEPSASSKIDYLFNGPEKLQYRFVKEKYEELINKTEVHYSFGNNFSHVTKIHELNFYLISYIKVKELIEKINSSADEEETKTSKANELIDNFIEESYNFRQQITAWDSIDAAEKMLKDFTILVEACADNLRLAHNPHNCSYLP